MKNDRVYLVSMPFAGINEPSIGLSILKAQLQRHDISCKITYNSLKFAEMIGGRWYDFIADSPTTQLIGEWIFSHEFNPRDDPEAFIHEVFLGNHPDHMTSHGGKVNVSSDLVENLLAVRQSASEFIDNCLEEIIEYRPRIVGFTSMFQQHAASIALAKRIKDKCPNIIVAFGGPNCEKTMGQALIRSFPFIDIVASGEAEVSFPTAVKRVLNDESYDDIPGIITRQNIVYPLHRTTAEVMPMDDIPVPDFADFFQQVHTVDIDGYNAVEYRVPFETSRGCWWGAKNHCTFCGLNGSSLTYRSKSQDRALEELWNLNETYPGREIIVVDNILDMKYFETFIPELAKWEKKVDLFYEIKANLRKKHIFMMYEAGIKKVQPGIESLSDEVLKMMRKGVSALQNIQTLKWCREHMLHVSWNILWGFPDEKPEHYDDVADMMPLLFHLEPPVVATNIRIDRFSPNFEDFQKMGFSGLHPYRSYELVYGLDEDATRNLAYYFVPDDLDLKYIQNYTSRVWQQFMLWRDNHAESALFYIAKEDHVIVIDTRPIAKNTSIILYGAECDIFLACDSIQSIQGLGKSYPNVNLDLVLDALEQKNLILRRKGSVLSLATELGIYQPRSEVLKKLQLLIPQAEQLSS